MAAKASRFIFTCKDSALTKGAAKDFLEAAKGIQIVSDRSPDATFLVEARKDVAEAFKAANASWNVYLEVKYPRPDTRLKIRSPK